MHPSRLFGLAAVLFKGVCAGTIDSRNGNATVTPAPRRNVRRERDFFVMNMVSPSQHGCSTQRHQGTKTPRRPRSRIGLRGLLGVFVPWCLCVEHPSLITT